MKILIYLSLLFSCIVLSFCSQCQINISTDSGSPQPLYLKPNTTKFFYPTDPRGIIEMDLNEQMELFCDQFTIPAGYFGSIIVECVSGTYFRHNGIVYNFRDLTCRATPQAVTPVRQNERCYNNASLVDVGYQVGNRLVKVFTTCHDPILETNHYTIYQLTPMSVASQTGMPSISWRQNGFYPGKNVDNLMTIATQRQTVATILESQESADFFIRTTTSQIFLARGHLAGRYFELFKDFSDDF